MKKIRALFNNSHQARRTLEALDEAGFGDDAAYGLGHSGVEVDDDRPDGRQLVVVKTEAGKVDTVQVILKNGGAVEVEMMDPDWEPDPDWDVAAFGRPTNA